MVDYSPYGWTMFYYGLSGGDIAKKNNIRNMIVDDAFEWESIRRWSAYDTELKRRERNAGKKH